MTSIAENFDQIDQLIRAAEQEFNRDSGAVSLLAVSKRHSIDRIREAAQWGQRDFGENYLQEAETKILALAELGLSWHFIGPLQSNKTRRVAELFDWVHSVDRLKIAQRLSEQRPDALPPLNICIQVKLSDEESKSGIKINDAPELCAQITDLPRIQLRGLMTIPAPSQGFAAQRAVFAQLSTEFRRLQTLYTGLDTLSMGMSNDYRAAIAEGSTQVRLGTALFGPRPS